MVFARRGGQFLGSGGTVVLVEAEAVDGHHQTAQLGNHIFATRQVRHHFAPVGEYLLALAGIWANAQWPAEMIEDDGLVWKCSCEVG